MDSLLSIVQMPAGVPVGTLAIGKAGAINAGAARRRDPRDERRGARGAARALARGADRSRWPKRPNDRSRPAPPSGSSAAASSAACSRWRRRSSATNATSSTRRAPAAPRRSPPASPAPPSTTSPPCAASAQASTSRPTNSRICRSPPLDVLGDKLRPGDPIARNRAGPRARESVHRGLRRPRRALAAGRQPRRRQTRRVAELGLPLVLKTRRYGYDGKGQAWIRSPERGGERLGGDRRRARGRRGRRRFRRRILGHRRALGRRPPRLLGFCPRTSMARASSAARPCHAATRSPLQVAEAREAALAHRRGARPIGVLTVEFFASRDGPVVNEIAPRVHNSGHWTIEGAVTSQFEQHIRAICDLPPGSTELAARGRGDGQSHRRRDRTAGPSCSPSPACTSTSTARARPARAARWDTSRASRQRGSQRESEAPASRVSLRVDDLDRDPQRIELRLHLGCIADHDPGEL